jgi:hypothetical protein
MLKFEIGDIVRWNDPAINDYPIEERKDALNREFEIIDIFGEDEDVTILISDGHTEVEVYPFEIEFA